MEPSGRRRYDNEAGAGAGVSREEGQWGGVDSEGLKSVLRSVV